MRLAQKQFLRLMMLVVCLVALFPHSTRTMAQSDHSSSGVPVDAIRDSARQVMEHSDFRSVRRRVLEQIPVEDMDDGFLTGIMKSVGNAIEDFFAWLFPPRAPRRPTKPPPASTSSFWDHLDLTRVLAIFLIVIVAGVIIWVLARILKEHQADPNRGGIPSIGDVALELAMPPGELAASTYESRAREYAKKGDYQTAIRELLLGSMSWIERAGLIRFRRGLTNRDYVRAVWRQEDRRGAYLVTGTEFELVFFGRRTATSEMFDRCLTAFQGAFCEEAETAGDEG